MNAFMSSSAPTVPLPPSAHEVLRTKAEQLRRQAANLQAAVRRLEILQQALPGLLHERAAEALRQIFGLVGGPFAEALQKRIVFMRASALEYFAEAEDLEILVESLPARMPAEAHDAINEFVFV